MEVNSGATVLPTAESGASTVEPKKEIKSNMPDDFKQDFFKHKERMKSAEQKAQELESRLREYELAEEQKKGNYSKVIDELKEKSKKLETDLKKRDFMYAEGNIKNALKSQAKEMGCKNVDAFIKLIGEDKLDIVSLDDAYNPDLDDIKMIVEDGMKQFEDIGLFGRNVNIVDGTPNAKPLYAPKKTYGEMSKEELEKELLSKYS